MIMFWRVKNDLFESLVGDWHCPSLLSEMETGHCGLTVSSPPAVMLGPDLAQASIRGMREPLSVSEVPSSLARYVTYVGDSESQAKYSSSIAQLAQDPLNTSSTALVILSNFSGPLVS